MALKVVVDTLEEMDEATQALYKKDGDKFLLDVDGVVPKAKLDEFRSNNIQLSSQLKEAKKSLKALEGIDPDTYKAMETKISDHEDKELLEEGKLDEVQNKRTEKLKSEHVEQVKGLKIKIDEADMARDKAVKTMNTKLVDIDFRRIGDNPDMGLEPGAMDVILSLVRDHFEVRDGKIVGINGSGELMYGADGNPLQPLEAIQTILKEKPFLVKTSTGGGAQSNKAGSANGNPVRLSKETSKDPRAYRRAKEEADRKGVGIEIS